MSTNDSINLASHILRAVYSATLITRQDYWHLGMQGEAEDLRFVELFSRPLSKRLQRHEAFLLQRGPHLDRFISGRGDDVFATVFKSKVTHENLVFVPNKVSHDLSIDGVNKPERSDLSKQDRACSLCLP